MNLKRRLLSTLSKDRKDRIKALLGRNETVKTALQAIAILPPDPRPAENPDTQAEMIMAFDRSVSDLAELPEMDFKAPVDRDRLFRAFLEHGNLLRALALAEVDPVDPGAPVGAMRRAQALLALQRPDAVCALVDGFDLDAALAVDPDAVRALRICHGMALIALGKAQEGFAVLRAVRAAAPDLPEAGVALLTGLTAGGAWEEADMMCDALAAAHPEDLAVMTATLDVLYARNRLAKARALALSFDQVRPGSVVLGWRFCRLYHALGEADRFNTFARFLTRRMDQGAVLTEPGAVSCLMGLGDVDDWGEATALRAAIARQLRRVAQGVSGYNDGRLPQKPAAAARHLRNAVELDDRLVMHVLAEYLARICPFLALPHVVLARLALDEGDVQTCVARLEAVDRIDPTRPDARALRARLDGDAGALPMTTAHTAAAAALDRMVPAARARSGDLSGRVAILGGADLGADVLALRHLSGARLAGSDVTLSCDLALAPVVARSFPGIAVRAVDQFSPARFRSHADRRDDVFDRALACRLDTAMGHVVALADQVCLTEELAPVPTGGSAAPWLVPDPTLVGIWQRRLWPDGGSKRRIGLVWQPEREVDPARMDLGVTLRDLLPLRDRGDALVCLQGDLCVADHALALEMGMCLRTDVDWSRDVDTVLAVVSGLDAVIGVPSLATALAAAAGVPVISLAPLLTGGDMEPGGMAEDPVLPNTRAPVLAPGLSRVQRAQAFVAAVADADLSG